MLCDGGAGGGPPTNIQKLGSMVVDRSAQQIAFRDPGLGFGLGPVTGSAGGVGLSRNVRACYRFVFDHYEVGDRIFLFGFGRGAATVRSLSAFIHLFGMLPEARPDLIRRAYAIHRLRDDPRRRQRAEAFVARHQNLWVRIHFLGVWDTVAGLGVPLRALDLAVDRAPFLRHRFHDRRLSPSVECAYHALALDDERAAFQPVLWDADVEPYQRMEQVWFAGVHGDVGGGYADAGLADISLEWMLQKATGRGLEIYPRHSMSLKPNPDGVMHDSCAGVVGKLLRRQVRSWPADHGRPLVHASVHDRRRSRVNAQAPRYDPWIRAVPHDVTG